MGGDSAVALDTFVVLTAKNAQDGRYAIPRYLRDSPISYRTLHGLNSLDRETGTMAYILLSDMAIPRTHIALSAQRSRHATTGGALKR
jgi:hypothetical protein